MRHVLFAAMMLPSLLSLPGAALAASCTDYIQEQIEIMKEAAKRCGASAAAMATFPKMNPPAKLDCTTPLDSRMTQLSSFEQCARVYYCGARAYACAEHRAPAGVSALDQSCRAAMQNCLNENPVPR